MSRRLLLDRAVAATAVTSAAATFSTLLTWDGLSDDASAFLVPLFWVTVGVAAGGALLRAAGSPRWVVPVVQLLGVALVLHHGWAPQSPLGGWVPDATSLRTVADVLHRSATAAGAYPAPVPATVTGFSPLLLLAGSAVAVAVDLLACTLRRPPLAGLVLLAGFTAPVSILGGVSWLLFGLAALSFVLLLAADQAVRLSTWGMALGGGTAIEDTQPRHVRLGTLMPAATRLALAGVGVAVLAPALLPSHDGLLGSGFGSGSGNGDDEIRIVNPMIDMRRDLTSTEDRPAVMVRTDAPEPAYLRLSVLDEFNGATWSPSERDIPATHRVDGVMPSAPGLLPLTPRTRHDWDITLLEGFRTTWLPTPYPASSVRVEGDWRYDLDTLDLLSAVEDQPTVGLSYQVEALDVRPTAAGLVAAAPPAAAIARSGTALPASMPPWVRDRALEVTQGARSPFESAVMIQQWFREDGGFTYSLDPAPGTGIEQMARFLGDGDGGRTGYCEQFASAMALMARTLDIPARVAVGFLRPQRMRDGSYVFSSADLHAWPELYFSGAGWIGFEPTPDSRTGSVPGYTAERVPAPEATATSESASASSAPPTSPGALDEANSGADVDIDATGPSWLVPALVLCLLLVVAALTPALVRRTLRHRRLATRDVSPGRLADDVWREVRATALDLRRGWDDGATLRRQALRLGPALARGEDDGAGLAELEQLTLLVERARYARDDLDAAESARVRALGRSVTDRLTAAARPRARRRARWLPASLSRASATVRDRRGAESTQRPTDPGAPVFDQVDKVSV